jgi:hypothetical protein
VECAPLAMCELWRRRDSGRGRQLGRRRGGQDRETGKGNYIRPQAVPTTSAMGVGEVIMCSRRRVLNPKACGSRMTLTTEAEQKDERSERRQQGWQVRTTEGQGHRNERKGGESGGSRVAGATDGGSSAQRPRRTGIGVHEASAVQEELRREDRRSSTGRSGVRQG